MNMSRNESKLAMVVLLMISSSAFAQSSGVQADQQAYCEYISQQAMAQRDLLRTPSAVAGVTQPTEALPMEAVWGVSSSVSDLKKSGLTMDVARKNCDLYSASTLVQQDIQYALPNLEKQALQHRLELIQQASQKLDSLTAGMTKMLAVQNVTRPMLFSLETTRIKLDADQADTQSKIAALYAPEGTDPPIKDLVEQKQAGEVALQHATDKLNRQNDWDVALTFGGREQINPFDRGGLYGSVTVSYNLGSHAINKHLDKTADAYAQWKKVQQGDVVKNADILKKQITDGISAQQSRLNSLQDEGKQVEANLQRVSQVDTSAALDFRNQLAGTQLLLDVDTGDASYRLQALQDFLEKNF
jgi:hypothetical protein